MNATMRKVGALFAKDAADLVKNPSMLICSLLPVAFALLYRFVFADLGEAVDAAAVDQTAAAAAHGSLDALLLSIMICTSIGMVVSMAIVYGIAEEKEKRTLRTLMLANVHGSEIVASRGAVALAATVLVAAVCFFVVGADPALFPAYLGLTALGCVPVILLSLVLGLAARDQMTAGLYVVPILIAAFGPLFGTYDETAAAVVKWLPTGGATQLMQLAAAGELFSPDAVAPLATCLAWTAFGAVLFALLYRRLLRDN